MNYVPRLVPEPAKPHSQAPGGSNAYEMHDTLRHGFRSVRADVITGHPLENSVKNQKQFEEERKYAIYKSSMGFHSIMRMEMDKAYLGQIKKVPALGSRNMALDTLNGNDLDIDFCDFLNSEYLVTLAEKEAVKPMDVHGSMEYALKMNI